MPLIRTMTLSFIIWLLLMISGCVQQQQNQQLHHNQSQSSTDGSYKLPYSANGTASAVPESTTQVSVYSTIVSVAGANPTYEQRKSSADSLLRASTEHDDYSGTTTVTPFSSTDDDAGVSTPIQMTKNEIENGTASLSHSVVTDTTASKTEVFGETTTGSLHGSSSVSSRNDSDDAVTASNTATSQSNVTAEVLDNVAYNASSSTSDGDATLTVTVASAAATVSESTVMNDLTTGSKATANIETEGLRTVGETTTGHLHGSSSVSSRSDSDDAVTASNTATSQKNVTAEVLYNVAYNASSSTSDGAATLTVTVASASSIVSESTVMNDLTTGSNATVNIETEGLGTATSTHLAATDSVSPSSTAGVDAEVTMSSQHPVGSSSASAADVASDTAVVNATDLPRVTATRDVRSNSSLLSQSTSGTEGSADDQGEREQADQSLPWKASTILLLVITTLLLLFMAVLLVSERVRRCLTTRVATPSHQGDIEMYAISPICSSSPEPRRESVHSAQQTSDLRLSSEVISL